MAGKNFIGRIRMLDTIIHIPRRKNEFGMIVLNRFHHAFGIVSVQIRNMSDFHAVPGFWQIGKFDRHPTALPGRFETPRSKTEFQSESPVSHKKIRKIRNPFEKFMVSVYQFLRFESFMDRPSQADKKPPVHVRTDGLFGILGIRNSVEFANLLI